MDGTQVFARPVTVTEERVRDALEKQAKQRALREALDSQLALRRNDAQPQLSKAQLKRQEVMQAALEREREQQQLGAFPAQQQQQQQEGYPSQINHYNHQHQHQHQHLHLHQHFGGVASSSPSALPSLQGVPRAAPAGPLHHHHHHHHHWHQHQQHHTSGLSPRRSNGDGFGDLARPIPVAEAPPLSPTRAGGVGPSSGRAQPLMDFVRRATDQPYQIREQRIEDIASWDNEEPPGAAPRASAVSPVRGSRVRGSVPSSGAAAGSGPGLVPRQQQDQQQQHHSRVRSSRAEAPSRDGLAGGKPAPRRESRDAARRQVQEQSKLLQLEKDLQRREAEMSKLRDKERDWEQQVCMLRAELKQAKHKERELAKLARDRQPLASGAGAHRQQQRAETAPDGGSLKQSTKPRQLQPLPESGRPQAPPGGKRPKPLGQGAGRHADLNQTKILTSSGEALSDHRPITAPNPLDPAALSERGAALPPLATSGQLRTSFGGAGGSAKPSYVSVKHGSPAAPQAITVRQLHQLAESQLITHQQAEQLWSFFSEGAVHAKQPTPPPTGHPNPAVAARLHQLSERPHGDGSRDAVQSLRTYETYAELDDSEGAIDHEGSDDEGDEEYGYEDEE